MAENVLEDVKTDAANKLVSSVSLRSPTSVYETVLKWTVEKLGMDMSKSRKQEHLSRGQLAQADKNGSELVYWEKKGYKGPKFRMRLRTKFEQGVTCRNEDAEI
jgi:hypothetical protein